MMYSNPTPTRYTNISSLSPNTPNNFLPPTTYWDSLNKVILLHGHKPFEIDIKSNSPNFDEICGFISKLLHDLQKKNEKIKSLLNNASREPVQNMK